MNAASSQSPTTHIYIINIYMYISFSFLHTPKRSVFFEHSLRILLKRHLVFLYRLSAECPILHYWLAWSMIGSRIRNFSMFNVQNATAFIGSFSSKEYLLVTFSTIIFVGVRFTYDDPLCCFDIAWSDGK